MDRPRLQALTLSCALLAGVLAAGSLDPAAAQSPASPRAQTSAPTLDAARAAFEALPEADRKALQDALIWTTSYSGIADGTFGRQTFDAVVSFQANAQIAPTGILSPKERAVIADLAKRAKDAVGFTVLDDPRSGVRIGVPTKFLPKQDVNPNGGSRWQSADGKVTLDTRVAPSEATLQALYDRNLAIQTPGRVVTYKILRPDFYVIAGETPTGKFYSRYASGPAGIRAFSIGYDKALASQVDKLVVAIANSFVPFPTAAAPAAVAQSTAPAPRALPPQPQTKAQAQRLIGTGLVIGPRQVVTTASAEACKDVRAASLKPQQVNGKGLVLMEFAEDLKAKPAALAQGSMAEGTSLLIAAFAQEDGKVGLTVSPGVASTASTFTAPLQPGASGAPVFDENHALIGLVGLVSSDQRKIAGVMTSASYGIAPAAELAKLAPHKETAAPKPGAAALMASLQGSLVPITCEP